MKHYGVKFDESYYTDLDRRIKTSIFIQRKLYERFRDLGMGDPNCKRVRQCNLSENEIWRRRLEATRREIGYPC